MVDVVSTISAAASIEAPAIVDLTDSQHFTVSSSPRFGIGDLLTGVFGDLVSFFEGNGGKAASAVYRRWLDC